MEAKSIYLKDIPEVLLPVIASNERSTLWLNGMRVVEVFTMRNQFRVNVERGGQYRYGLDTDLALDIT